MDLPKLLHAENKEELKLWADKLIAYLRDSGSAGGGSAVIKSIQRGTISITGTNLTNTATITAVNTAKAELRLVGQSTTSSVLPSFAYLQLTDSTTITATRLSSSSSTTTVSYEVTEFE